MRQNVLKNFQRDILQAVIKNQPPTINHLDNQRFAQLNNNDYTIQILQAQYFDTIRKLIDQYQDRQTYVLKIKRNNKLFYVLNLNSG